MTFPAPENPQSVPSRDHPYLLFELANGERTVEQLAATAGLEQSATSHRLRLLRTLRLVRVRRAGRHSFYALHDHHVVELLASVRHHREHVHPPAAAEIPAPSTRQTATCCSPS